MKVFVFLAFLLGGSVVFGAFEHPGWKCTNIERIDAAIAAAPDHYQRGVLQVIRRLADRPAGKFAELTAAVEEIAETLPSSANKEFFVKKCIKQLCVCRGEFLADAFALTQTFPESYDINFYLYKQKELGLSDKDVYAGIIQSLLKYEYSPAVVNKSIDLAVNKTFNFDCATMKRDFSLLNRKYSAKLLKSQTDWEPVVAMIRTILAAI